MSTHKLYVSTGITTIIAVLGVTCAAYAAPTVGQASFYPPIVGPSTGGGKTTTGSLGGNDGATPPDSGGSPTLGDGHTSTGDIGGNGGATPPSGNPTIGGGKTSTGSIGSNGGTTPPDDPSGPSVRPPLVGSHGSPADGSTFSGDSNPRPPTFLQRCRNSDIMRCRGVNRIHAYEGGPVIAVRYGPVF